MRILSPHQAAYLAGRPRENTLTLTDLPVVSVSEAGLLYEKDRGKQGRLVN
jgi:hypothetical protein